MNALTDRREYHGALIRVNGGYGCLHPWPEFGDFPLDGQLEYLERGLTTPLIRSALRCAEADGRARREGVSLFDGVDVPLSHATLPMRECSFSDACEAGFDRVKVKMGRDLDQEASFVRRMAERYPDLRWRMDFNNSQSRADIVKLLDTWDESLLERIDFLEDAYVSSGETDCCCSMRGVAVAVDREVEQQPGDAAVWVVKPAVNQMDMILEAAVSQKKKVVITSYMDHPLGQSYAAWQAGVGAKNHPGGVAVCGLVTQGLFEPDAFTEALGSPSPRFQADPGTGLGFDSLLEQLPWKRLI